MHRGSSIGGRGRQTTLQIALVLASFLFAACSLSAPAYATYECAKGRANKPAACTVTVCKATITSFRPLSTVRLANGMDSRPGGIVRRTLTQIFQKITQTNKKTVKKIVRTTSTSTRWSLVGLRTSAARQKPVKLTARSNPSRDSRSFPT
jgi:hypothetical protein